MDEIQEKISIDEQEEGEKAEINQMEEEKKLEIKTQPFPPIPKRKKRSFKKATRFRLSKFDFILLQLLKEGKTDLKELRTIFNIAESTFNERLQALSNQGLISVEEGEVHLSIKAVNDYTSKWKKAADEWLARKESKIVRRENDNGNEGRERENEKFDLEKSIQAKLPVEVLWKELEKRHEQIQELPEDKRHEETVDIMALIRKYGPTAEQKAKWQKPSPFIERHIKKNERSEKAEEKGERNTATERKPPAAAEGEINLSAIAKKASKEQEKGEKCELCKSEFLISVNQHEHNPKYGHCFCGAPYHKDCFDAVIAGDSKCVRCGRKLAGGSDFKVEEAFKQITDISF